MINVERWYKFSLCEQMGHIGSEITRARVWEDKNDSQSRNKALERAFELIDTTKDDARLYKRRRELCYLREILADKYINAAVYSVSLKDLEEYCLDFALVANKNK
jgi:hypothetical protein